MNFVLVAADCPFNDSLLVYASEYCFACGDIVQVPLGKRKVLGCIINEALSKDDAARLSDHKEIKEISDVPIAIKIQTAELQVYQWMAKYYHYPLGMLIFDVIPKILKRPRIREHIRAVAESSIGPSPTEMQQHIIDAIAGNFAAGFSKNLIHGVTGSGKTVIYLSLIKQLINMQKSILLLVPEINLTPQLISFFEANLSCDITTYHSEKSDSEKFLLWERLQTDDIPKLIVGVRSSIFLPIKNLGMIIVDEEHDQSFKQEDRCVYNARDVAIKKASIYKIPVVLGSATPSLENYYQFTKLSALKNNYFTLKERAQRVTLPRVIIEDGRIKKESRTAEIEKLWPFSEQIINRIKEYLNKREQILIFVNRLGFSSYLQCRSCGKSFDCPNCSLRLRYYKKRNEIMCHCCEYKVPTPEGCPDCGNMKLLQKGFGTERLEQILKEQLPTARIGRFDRDAITNFQQLEKTLSDFKSEKLDILVGTQMLSKGHNFEKVKLVVVLGIDSQLNFPDFRSNERAYQLLTQVGGRSGRYGEQGEVIIQTANPDNPLFNIISNHQFDLFYDQELKIREIAGLPPFSKIAMIYFSGKKIETVMSELERFSRFLIKVKEQKQMNVEILGPRPALVEKKVNNYSGCLMLKGPDINEIHTMLSVLNTYSGKRLNSRVKIDVDPYHIS